jgi:hypothetical protein
VEILEGILWDFMAAWGIMMQANSASLFGMLTHTICSSAPLIVCSELAFLILSIGPVALCKTWIPQNLVEEQEVS